MSIIVWLFSVVAAQRTDADVQVVEELISAGVDVKHVINCIGRSALMYAAMINYK